MRPRMKGALGALAIGGALAVWSAACLPPDRSIERGAIYTHLRAGPLRVDYGSYRVDFERLTMILGADTIGCHARFYVDRSSGPVRIVDMARPYTFEHRAITDEECVVAAGFIQAQDAPVADPALPESEVKLVEPSPPGQLGTMHVVARVTYVVPEEDDPSAPPIFQKRVDVLLFGVTGAKSSVLPVPVPHGDKNDVESKYQTITLANQLVTASFYDLNRDDLVTTAELDTTTLEALRRAASDQWTDVVRTTDELLAREADAGL